MNSAVKILSVSSDESFVTVLKDNGDTLVCDIVVGAGGTYSTVRQSIFDQMRRDKVMDSKDMEPMKCSTICLIGQTRPLNDVEFPSWLCRTLKYLNNDSHDENNPFRTSDWGQATVDLMCEKVKDITIIAGGYRRATVDHLIDLSGWTEIKKVVVEEKVFSKWHY
ncbi:hypothetical protein KI688_005776 [Linnemannia hyalina]|uniref:Uncharacterized protein n=1 Tax=Linnemannia hyalina TaxID=64524 RepID=A0A9P7Y4Y1_9FUNG|nr:hypothetical protein KI688_005776 [Linnemannia hyalina]